MDGPLTGGTYEIVVGAQLDTDWSSWFTGFSVRSEGDTTRLVGVVTDQAGLHGVLERLRDLGIPILTVERVGADGDSSGPNTPRGT